MLKLQEEQFSSSIYECEITREELESIENPVVRKITTGLLMDMPALCLTADAKSIGAPGQPPNPARHAIFGERGMPPVPRSGEKMTPPNRAHQAAFGEGGMPPAPQRGSSFGEKMTPPNPAHHAIFGEGGMPPVPRREAGFGETTTPPNASSAKNQK